MLCKPRDKTFSDRLFSALRESGVDVWYFPDSARGRKRIWSEISEAIGKCEKLLVVCSEASLKSVLVLRELERAFGREDRERAEIVFPVVIDDALFDDSHHPRAADLVSIVAADFRDWHEEEEFQTP